MEEWTVRNTSLLFTSCLIVLTLCTILISLSSFVIASNHEVPLFLRNPTQASFDTVPNNQRTADLLFSAFKFSASPDFFRNIPETEQKKYFHMLAQGKISTDKGVPVEVQNEEIVKYMLVTAANNPDTAKKIFSDPDTLILAKRYFLSSTPKPSSLLGVPPIVIEQFLSSISSRKFSLSALVDTQEKTSTLGKEEGLYMTESTREILIFNPPSKIPITIAKSLRDPANTEAILPPDVTISAEKNGGWKISSDKEPTHAVIIRGEEGTLSSNNGNLLLTTGANSVVILGNKNVQDSSLLETTFESVNNQIHITDSKYRSLVIEGNVQYNSHDGSAIITLPDGKTITVIIEPKGTFTYKNQAETVTEWKKHFEELGKISTHKDLSSSLYGSIEFSNARVEISDGKHTLWASTEQFGTMLLTDLSREMRGQLTIDDQRTIDLFFRTKRFEGKSAKLLEPVIADFSKLIKENEKNLLTPAFISEAAKLFTVAADSLQLKDTELTSIPIIKEAKLIVLIDSFTGGKLAQQINEIKKDFGGYSELDKEQRIGVIMEQFKNLPIAGKLANALVRNYDLAVSSAFKEVVLDLTLVKKDEQKTFVLANVNEGAITGIAVGDTTLGIGTRIRTEYAQQTEEATLHKARVTLGGVFDSTPQVPGIILTKNMDSTATITRSTPEGTGEVQYQTRIRPIASTDEKDVTQFPASKKQETLSKFEYFVDSRTPPERMDLPGNVGLIDEDKKKELSLGFQIRQGLLSFQLQSSSGTTSTTVKIPPVSLYVEEGKIRTSSINQEPIILTHGTEKLYEELPFVDAAITLDRINVDTGQLYLKIEHGRRSDLPLVLEGYGHKTEFTGQYDLSGSVLTGTDGKTGVVYHIEGTKDSHIQVFKEGEQESIAGKSRPIIDADVTSLLLYGELGATGKQEIKNTFMLVSKNNEPVLVPLPLVGSTSFKDNGKPIKVDFTYGKAEDTLSTLGIPWLKVTATPEESTQIEGIKSNFIGKLPQVTVENSGSQWRIIAPEGTSFSGPNYQTDFKKPVSIFYDQLTKDFAIDSPEARFEFVQSDQYKSYEAWRKEYDTTFKTITTEISASLRGNVNTFLTGVDNINFELEKQRAKEQELVTKYNFLVSSEQQLNNEQVTELRSISNDLQLLREKNKLKREDLKELTSSLDGYAKVTAGNDYIAIVAAGKLFSLPAFATTTTTLPGKEQTYDQNSPDVPSFATQLWSQRQNTQLGVTPSQVSYALSNIGLEDFRGGFRLTLYGLHGTRNNGINPEKLLFALNLNYPDVQKMSAEKFTKIATERLQDQQSLRTLPPEVKNALVQNIIDETSSILQLTSSRRNK